jgi:hypothetical protein
MLLVQMDFNDCTHNVNKNRHPMQTACISLIGLLLLQLHKPSLSASCAAGQCTNNAGPCTQCPLPTQNRLGSEHKMKKMEFPAAVRFAADFKDIIGDGEYCTEGISLWQPSIIPLLDIVGMGTFPLPFPDDQVQRLKDVAIQSLYGQGSETVVDTEVRNSFQIDASKVNITHPTWQSCIASITRQAAKDLGIYPDLVASELYKLLVYEEGGSFQNAQRQRKGPRHVCNPCGAAPHQLHRRRLHRSPRRARARLPT